jgi:hypothetical protein
MCTYGMADYRFKTGDDLISQLEVITSDFDLYMKESDKSRKYVESMWLEDHIDEYEAIYFTDWASKDRNTKSPNLIKNNSDQKV